MKYFFATSGENRLSISFSKKDCAAGLSCTEPGKWLLLLLLLSDGAACIHEDLTLQLIINKWGYLQRVGLLLPSVQSQAFLNLSQSMPTYYYVIHHVWEAETRLVSAQAWGRTESNRVNAPYSNHMK